MTDREILYVAALVRATATGFIGIVLGLHLAASGLDASGAGLIIAAGLAGAAAVTAVATLAADRIGRRRFLIGLALLGAAGAVAVALSSSPAALALGAFAGMVNGMGRDRGAALVIEQAALPGTVMASERTQAFAVYNVVQDIGHAVGALAAGLPELLATDPAAQAEALQIGVFIYAGAALLPLLFYVRLSAAIEPAATAAPQKASPETRRVLGKIGGLFFIDSFGGGFLTASLITWFFAARFGVDGRSLGPLFFIARLANAGSHLGAAWLARRIGLVNTMVFTHIPSSLLLVTVAFAPSFEVAAALFLLREGLVEMDVPTRQSYVMALVQPHERTLASGVTHLVRLAGWAIAPAFAGLLMDEAALMLPLVVGAGLKILYDILLYLGFRRVRPPEENGSG
jgi:MFS family permease